MYIKNCDYISGVIYESKFGLSASKSTTKINTFTNSLIHIIQSWGPDFDVVLFECEWPTPPHLSPRLKMVPKRFGMVREQVWKNYFLGQEFLPDPQKRSYGKKSPTRRAFLRVKHFVKFVKLHFLKALAPPPNNCLGGTDSYY